MGNLAPSAFPLRSTTFPARFPLRFPQRNRLAGPVETVAPVLVPRASPEFWCPHVQTARPFERSFFPRIRPTRITWPQNLCVPYASAVTYARCPTFSFETSLSSTPRRTRRTESSAMVITGESNCVETLSPPCRSVLLLLR